MKQACKQRRRMKDIIANVSRVHADIESGSIHLPDPGEGACWTLYDTGSSTNAADHAKHVPGAHLDDEPVPGNFLSATGEPFKNKGKFEIPWLSENRHKRKTIYLDAPVSMPITSGKLWNADGFRTTLEEDTGETVHKASGEKDPVVVRRGRLLYENAGRSEIFA